MSSLSVLMFPSTWQFPVKVLMSIMLVCKRKFDIDEGMKRATRQRFCGHSISFALNWTRLGRQVQDSHEIQEIPANIEEEACLVS
jgi:hypothetical protein